MNDHVYIHHGDENWDIAGIGNFVSVSKMLQTVSERTGIVLLHHLGRLLPSRWNRR